MNRRDCFPGIDMLFTNKATGIAYHIIKAWYKDNEVTHFTMVDSNGNAYKLTAEWVVEKYKSRELSFTAQCNNWLGIEIGVGYDAVYVAERRK